MDLEDAMVDEARQSRIMIMMGKSAVLKMARARVFLSGMGGVGAEIAKNVALTGVRGITVHDIALATEADLGSQFFLRSEDVGQNRAVASVARLAELNPAVFVDTSTVDLATDDLSFLSNYQVVVVTDAPLEVQKRVDGACRGAGVPFVSAEVRGACAWAFSDFGDAFTVTDPTGSEPLRAFVRSITNEANGLVTCAKEHGFYDGDLVEFLEVGGMPELAGKHFVVEKVDLLSFRIGDTTAVGTHAGGGIAVEVQVPRTVAFKSLEEALKEPVLDGIPLLHTSDFAKNHQGAALLYWQALHAFYAERGILPSRGDVDAFAAVVDRCNVNGEAVDDDVVAKIAATARGELPPLAAFLGGYVGQEVLKAVSQKYMPLRQFFFLDALEMVPLGDPSVGAEHVGRDCRLRICVGDAACAEMARMKLFLVGAGAIGCEMLKNLAALGVATGPKGMVHVTDNDSIETSNLSRQFLFRDADVGTMKSEAAKRAVQDMHEDIHVTARTDRVGRDTEHVYTDKFFSKLDVCVNALDNIEARLYMDRRCVLANKPLLESGTKGPEGHVEIYLPHQTVSYASSVDPPDDTEPFCTIKFFPYDTKHCIEFARDRFARLFTNLPTLANRFLEATDPAAQLDAPGVEKHYMAIDMLAKRPTDFAACVRFARLEFARVFDHDIRALLHHKPPDLVDNGEPFWAPPKRVPTPLAFSAEDAGHLAFVTAAALLWARVWAVAVPGDPNAATLQVLPTVDVPKFRVDQAGTLNTDEKTASKEDEDSHSAESMAPAIAAVRAALAGGEKRKLVPEVFEKDDDSNGHISFLAALANLRARNFALPETTRLRAKQVAGHIIPAIATTTAAVSGLVSLNLVKLAMGKSREAMRNWSIRLQDPFVMAFEPMEAPRVRVTDDLSYTLWDTWSVAEDVAPTVQSLSDHIEATRGVPVTEVHWQANYLYMAWMPGHDDRLQCRIRDLLPTAERPKAVLFSLMTVVEGEKIPLPTVRYTFKATKKSAGGKKRT